jgi:hypothetical protein
MNAENHVDPSRTEGGANGRPRRMPIGPLLLLLFPIFLGACGAGNQPVSQPPEQSPAAARPGGAAASATTEQSVEAFKPSGLVVASCDFASLILTAINPDTGRIDSSVSLPASRYPVGCPAVGTGNSLQAREMFDAAFTRITTNIQQADGSNHVGFYDLRNGTLTDLTSKRVSKHSFSALPHEAGGLFHPGTDTFWYEAEVSTAPVPDIHAFVEDLSTEATVDKGPVGQGSVSVTTRPTYSLPQRVERPVAVVEGLPNPSGTFAASSNFCQPGVWIDNDRLICDRTLELVQFTSNYKSFKSTKLLPATDRRNWTPVMSPNGAEMAFVSFRAGEASIYRMPLTPGATPTKVADLPAAPLGIALLEWR